MRRLALVVAAASLAAACTAGPADPPTHDSPRSLCGLPQESRTWILNGHDPERSGEVQVVPREGYPVGPGISHAPPSRGTQHVPLFWYGPGQVPAVGPVEDPVTVADVAPTIAEMLGFAFDAPDGRELPDVVEDRDAEPPALVAVLIWDGVGRNVLEEHPDDWPLLRSLMADGVWYEDAVVGSSPSNTPAVHATVGTGAFPRRHGRMTLEFRIDGELVQAEVVGPADLRLPSLADEWDAARGNRPQVGLVGTRGWHLGLLGRGAAHPGGDRDLAALLDPETGAWGLTDPDDRAFAFPEVVAGTPGLEEELRRLDLADGEADGAWMGEEVLDDPLLHPLTPAFSAHQTEAVRRLVRSEGFGADGETDLLFLNYKQVDLAAHRWAMHAEQVRAALRASDEALGELTELFDEAAGPGRWALALTSDHGLVEAAEVSGRPPIDPDELARDLREAFGEETIEEVHSTQVFVDVAALEAAGDTLDDVAAFVAGYTRGQNVADPDALTAEEQRHRLFEAAFPGGLLERDPC